MKKYDAKYFINKFEKIPENKWCIRAFGSPTLGKYCALGHCGVEQTRDTVEGNALVDLFSTLSIRYGLGVVQVNDKEYISHPLGDTPKERIINALCMIDSGMLEDV